MFFSKIFGVRPISKTISWRVSRQNISINHSEYILTHSDAYKCIGIQNSNSFAMFLKIENPSFRDSLIPDGYNFKENELPSLDFYNGIFWYKKINPILLTTFRGLTSVLVFQYTGCDNIIAPSLHCHEVGGGDFIVAPCTANSLTYFGRNLDQYEDVALAIGH